MSPSNPQKLTYAELDRLTGEVLPRRLALSAGNGGGDGGGDTEVFYACQATQSAGTSGLLGTGLLAEAPTSTVTCVPAVVVHDAP
ncbi:hypothetical protein [Actinomadura citrea]|jgi:hypothetical protein|uniref:Uncharacterized protein n=1 Tax=Actinomadura citrea TaxID=46158 RepID=A0A7Y9KC01_9ACTN|nr:hypothetical protein [Actinomadura citrea]NYE11781.1 hypothetical protein [Actinomadura citrea]GGT91404.1 hypothetical protein GCM10010177_58380 [Actinomadura citrea]